MTSGPRVLQVVLRLDPGGTERLVIELAKRLHSQIPMAVCCLDDAGAWAHELVECGIEVTALQRGPGFQPALGSACRSTWRGGTVPRCCTRTTTRRSSTAASHGSGVRHCASSSPSTDGCRTPRRRRSGGWRTRVFRRFSRDVFAVSEDVKAHLVGEGFGARQVGVIYNGIDVGPLPDRGTAGGDSPAARGRRRRVRHRHDRAARSGQGSRDAASRRGDVGATSSARPSSWSATAPSGTPWRRWHWNWASRRASGFLASGTTRATGWRDAMRTSTLNQRGRVADDSGSDGGRPAGGRDARRRHAGGRGRNMRPARPPVATPSRWQRRCARSLKTRRLRTCSARAARGRVEARFTLARMVCEYARASIAPADRVLNDVRHLWHVRGRRRPGPAGPGVDSRR